MTEALNEILKAMCAYHNIESVLDQDARQRIADLYIVAITRLRSIIRRHEAWRPIVPVERDAFESACAAFDEPDHDSMQDKLMGAISAYMSVLKQGEPEHIARYTPECSRLPTPVKYG